MNKWTKEQTKKLKELAFDGKSNKDIAAALGRPVTDIYAKRSALGITRAKVAASSNGSQKLVKTQQTSHPATKKVAKKTCSFLELLEQTLRAAGEKVKLTRDGGIITIHHDGGGVQNINVAWDSDLAIMLDVVKRLM